MYRSKISIFIVMLLSLNLFACTSTSLVKLGGGDLDVIRIDKPALYPEGIDYNPISDTFVVGSFREGAVYEVSLDGSYRKIVEDNRLSSVLAVRVDVKTNRLLVVNSDIGSSLRPSAKGSKKLAALAIYELSTGEPIDYIDLGRLKPQQAHLANGMTLDEEGNAYITDSFSPIIYKVDINGQASIFLENDRFLGEGINLNGIVYHPNGFLLVVKKGEGSLFKVPLSDPGSFTEIKLKTKLIGGDGLILASDNELIAIANRASGKVTETVFSLKSTDDWNTAELVDDYKFGKVYLTTGVIRKHKIYVMHSNLSSLIKAPKEEKNSFHTKAVIQQVGTLR